MAHTLLRLGMHPSVQDKVFEELKNVFSTADELVDDEKINQLVYLEMVINESLRLLPPASFIARQAEADIEIGGYTIPCGATLVIPIFEIHRKKSIWGDDADSFKPDRFAPENLNKIPPYAFIPFSGGSRNCVAVKYAMTSMKITLAYFLRHYKVSTNLKLNELEYEFALILRIVQGCMISLEKRHF
jgi:cytochrome P450